MEEIRRGWTFRLLRPDVASLLAVGLWLVSFLLPPQFVEPYLEERDVVFLNLPMAMVVVVSAVAFWKGTKTGKTRGHRRTSESQPRMIVTRSLLSKVFWVALVIPFFEILVIFTVLHKVGIGTLLLATQNPTLGTAWRTDVSSTLRLGGINFGALVNCCYAALVSCTFAALWADPGRGKRRICLILLGIGGLLYALTSLILFQRWPLFEYLLSMLVALLVYRDLKFGVTRAKVVGLIAGSALVCTAIFFLVNALRTSSTGSSMLLGYTVGSYNLGAAAISGSFHQPHAHSTYATFGWFWDAPLIGATLRNLGISLGLDLPLGGALAPTAAVEWPSAVASAGLNPAFQWDTMFARIYADVGVLFPLVFFVYGYACQRVYERFCRLDIFGVFLYVPLLVNILSWFSGVALSTPFDDYLLSALIIWIWLKDLWIIDVNGQMGSETSRTLLIDGKLNRISAPLRRTD